MANRRPIVNDLALALFPKGAPVLDRHRVQALSDIARSTSVESRHVLERRQVDQATRTSLHLLTYYADGVSDLLDWLNGAPPSHQLTVLLDLEA